MKKNISIISIFLFYIGCQTIIEVPVPDSHEKIVVNALFSPDSLMKVSVYESLDFYDTTFNFIPIQNAHVTARSSSGLEYEFYNDNDFYFSDNYPEYGETYELTVTVPEYLDPVTAKTNIPVQEPNFQIIDYGYGFSANECDNRFYVEIQIDDPPKEDNYYAISIEFEELIYNINFEKQLEYIEDTINRYHLLNIYHKGSEYLYIYGSRLNFCINGKYFDGESTRVKIWTEDCAEWYKDKPQYLSFKVILMEVNSDYYQYSVSYNSDRPGISDIWEEPGPIYSNIQGGLGIFGANTTSQIQLDHPDKAWFEDLN